MADAGDDEAMEGILVTKSMTGLLKFVEKAGVDAVLTVGGKERPLILHCSRFGFTEGVMRLVSDGADVRASDKAGKTALHQAQSAAVVEALLAAGADLEAKNAPGSTPLMIASVNGRAEPVKALISAGAAVNAVDNEGMTALMEAARNGHKRVVRLLLVHGAEAGLKDKAGKSAEQRATESGHGDVADIIRAGAAAARAAIAAEDAVVRAIKAADLDGLPAFIASTGINALVTMDSETLPLIAQCARSDFTDGVLRLIKDGADVNACDADGYTPLHYAKSAAVVTALLAAGAGIETASAYGSTPLMNTSFYGHAASVQALIAAGAAVDAVDEDGMTALMAAAVGRHERAVQLLLAGGASAGVKNKDGKSAEQWAMESGYEDIAAVIRAGADAARAALAAEQKAAADEERAKEEEESAAAAKAAGPAEGIMIASYRLLSPLSVGRSMNTLWRASGLGKLVVIKLFSTADPFCRERDALIALAEAGCTAVVPVVGAVESADVGGMTMHALILPSGSMNLLAWSRDDHTLLERKAALGAMALAIAEVHACGWMVGDVKPDNVVMFDGKWKLIDFGGAVRIGSPVSGEMSVAYMPPEQARAVRDGSTLTAHASYDVWCFGQSVLTVLRGGKPLFGGWSDGDVMDELLRDGPLSVGSLQSGSAQRLLVGHCLRKDSAARSSMAVVLGDSFMASTTTASKLVSAVDGGSDVDASVSAAMKEAMAAHAHKLLAASISKEVSSALRTVLSGEIGGMAARLEEMARNMAESGEAHAEQLAEVAELVDGMLEGGSGSGGAVAMEEVKMEEVAPASGSMSIDDFLATVKPKFAAKYAAVFHEQDIDTLAELVKAGLDDAFASDIGLTAGASRLIRSALTRVRLC
eukprot:PLAT11614.17.p1 GENE.PLAT11614.17~~PLAT11614.17.p1  ORF type:complete len:873 (-),score=344.32 PLAT11614.17:252-2870(-)